VDCGAALPNSDSHAAQQNTNVASGSSPYCVTQADWMHLTGSDLESANRIPAFGTEHRSVASRSGTASRASLFQSR